LAKNATAKEQEEGERAAKECFLTLMKIIARACDEK
jgi:hypothetical protein